MWRLYKDDNMSLPFVMAHKKYKSKQKLDIGTWVNKTTITSCEAWICLLSSSPLCISFNKLVYYNSKAINYPWFSKTGHDTMSYSWSDPFIMNTHPLSKIVASISSSLSALFCENANGKTPRIHTTLLNPIHWLSVCRLEHFEPKKKKWGWI